MKSPTVLQLKNVSKKYEIHHEKPTLVEKFVKSKNETFWALSGINISIAKGQKVGIIGANGSGKTTLLKTIAGITAPTTGTIESQGKIVSLIDLEAGFHDDLTGVQNIFLNGMLLGLSKRQIMKDFQSIVSYADIRQFIDAPLFTYSYGMKLRLGFSVAIHANPDILLLDENMAVGDKEFRKKSLRTTEEFIRKRKTIIVVSHWVEFLRKTCTRIIYLKEGKVKADGNTHIIDVYLKEK